MGWKPGSVKKEELENKLREEDAAKAAIHEQEVAHRKTEVRQNAPVPMQPDGDPKIAKGQTEGSMTQWMFTVSNQLAELGNTVKELKALVSTLNLQLNRGAVDVEPPKKDPVKLEKELKETIKNNAPKKSASGMIVPPVIVDVPSLEVIAAALSKYVKRHGKAAAETRLAQYKVHKASELTDEQKALFLQDIAT